MTDEKWYLVDRWLGICSSDLWPRSIEILLHLLSWSWNNKINLTVGGWREQFQQKISWWTLLPQYDIEGQGPPPPSLIIGPPPPWPPSLHRHQLHIYLCNLHTPQSPHGTWHQHHSCWGGRLEIWKKLIIIWVKVMLVDTFPFHGWLQTTRHTDLLSFSATDLEFCTFTLYNVKCGTWEDILKRGLKY